MVIRDVNFGSFLFASLIAGYVLALVDYIFQGWFGLFGLFHHKGSPIGLGNPYWTLRHEIQSVIFSIPYATFFTYRVRFIKSRTLKGALYGFFFFILTRIVGFLGVLGDAPWLTRFMDKPVEAHISSLILHVIWGAVLGYLYVSPEEKNDRTT